MGAGNPLILSGNLNRQSLAGQVILITGAGQGIGYEAARSAAWLGGKVVIAEIDRRSGKAAEEAICREVGPSSALFVHTDVGDEGSIRNLARQVERAFGPVDVVFNNAAVEPFGAVHEVAAKDWDLSYQVNMRGPVLLARQFLPGMIARKKGAFICVSSVGAAYMAPYETMKAAQVQLARALDAELEGSEVITFTIGPGLVLTPAAKNGIEKIAPRMGISIEEFYEMNRAQIISVEEAGAGFAASIALAAQFKGMEIGSNQALVSAGIEFGQAQTADQPSASLSPEQLARARELVGQVRSTFAEQVDGWKKRPLFERQWMLRDFRQYGGQPAEQCQEELEKLEQAVQAGDLALARRLAAAARNAAKYYQHYAQLAEGYEKNPQRRKEISEMIHGYQSAGEQLADLLDGRPNE